MGALPSLPFGYTTMTDTQNHMDNLVKTEGVTAMVVVSCDECGPMDEESDGLFRCPECGRTAEVSPTVHDVQGGHND